MKKVIPGGRKVNGATRRPMRDATRGPDPDGGGGPGAGLWVYDGSGLYLLIGPDGVDLNRQVPVHQGGDVAANWILGVGDPRA